MNEEQKEIWKSLKYRMKEEGFDYCFDGYSDWLEVDDEEFHRLRKEYLKSAEILKKYILNKVESIKE